MWNDDRLVKLCALHCYSHNQRNDPIFGFSDIWILFILFIGKPLMSLINNIGYHLWWDWICTATKTYWRKRANINASTLKQSVWLKRPKHWIHFIVSIAYCSTFYKINNLDTRKIALERQLFRREMKKSNEYMFKLAHYSAGSLIQMLT